MNILEHSKKIFACNVGSDFSDEFVKGFIDRYKDFTPEYVTKINLFVNTNRLSNSIKESFLNHSPGFLPKISSVTDLRQLAIEYPLPKLSNLQQEQLQLNELIKKYLELSPNTAPKSSSYELAYDLINLRNEMYSEDVSVDQLRNLSKENISSHWQQSLDFLNIIFDYWGIENNSVPMEAINLEILSIIKKKWKQKPLKYPVIIAGSTGSRGITQRFIKLVAKQDMGLVVMPGFDFSQTKEVWDSFEISKDFEDHPQFRYFKLLTELSIHPKSVRNWETKNISLSPRNQLMSLALRPSPVTDQWLEDGPKIKKLNSATSGLTLIETATSRDEANSIALYIRKAVEEDKSISLITPDHDLLRQVKAALGRWNLIPDDVTGQPLSSTPVGIFLRQVINLIGQEITAEKLIPLLKNPLTNSSDLERGTHMNLVREIELQLREVKEINQPFMEFFAIIQEKSKSFLDPTWVSWIQNTLRNISFIKVTSLNKFLDILINTSELFSNGPSGKEGLLWSKTSGEKAKEILDNLILSGKDLGNIDFSEFNIIVNSTLQKETIRESVNAHPLIKFWGTLDARFSKTAITILGGMNEGVWPKINIADPWLSRSMRKEAGLLSPERRVGLLAHDFQQSINNQTVVITRSERVDDTPAIPSRWLSRIITLLKGLGDEGNQQLDNMKSRGKYWIDLARVIEEPEQNLALSERPSPIPPSSKRPKNLSVTQIEQLIRDPYSIYARHVLGLKKLQPLKIQATPLLKGNIIHKIMQKFSELTQNNFALLNEYELTKLSDQIFLKEVPWTAIGSIWKIQFRSVIPLFIEAEKIRRKKADPLFFEHPGSFYLRNADTTLTAIADRIDLSKSNELMIYDYKSGKPPTHKQLDIFHKQLLLEALIAANGGFQKVPTNTVKSICYISLNKNYPNTEKIISSEEIEKIDTEVSQLIKYYQSKTAGFTARLRMEKINTISDYDHLSRYGEWDESSPPKKLVLE